MKQLFYKYLQKDMSGITRSRAALRRALFFWCVAALCARPVHAQDAACTATVLGQGTSGQVLLPESLVTDFPVVGSTAKWTRFYVELNACPVTGVKAWTYFFSGHANAATGRLNNIPGVGQAAGLDLELTDGQGNPIQAHQGNVWGGGRSPVFDFDGSGSHRMEYGVRYYRSALISPGAIRSNVNYIVQFH